MEEVRNLHAALPCVLNGRSAIEPLELPSAIREGGESLTENPSREPSLCCCERFKALNGLEPPVELFVHTLDEIGGPWTINVQDGLGSDVGRELLTALEDVLHDGDLHGIVLVTGRAPANSGFQSFPSEDGNAEDMLLEISEEIPVGFLAAYPERPANVLEEMDMADLGDDAREDVLCSHTNRIVLVAGNTAQRVVHVLELREELDHCLMALRGGEEADGNVVRDVIHPVDEGNLLVRALHRDVFPIDEQRASKALPVAVPGGDVIVVGKNLEFLHQACVGRIEPPPNPCSQRTDTCALEMEIEERFLVLRPVINAEPAMAISALIPSQTIARAFLSRGKTAAGFAG